MLTIQKKISNYNFSSRNGNSIKYIVVHYTGNERDTAIANINYFCACNRNASAGYFVDDNSIWQLVEDCNAAWHCGGGVSYGCYNVNSIGIEMCCSGNYNVSEKTEANTLELVKYLMNKYNIPASNVIRHFDCNSIRKVCPNWQANNWQRWTNFKAKLNGQSISGATNTNTSTSSIDKAKEFVGSRCKELQEKLNKAGYNCGTADGIFGQATYNALTKFQSEHGLTADGLAGNATFAKLDQVIAAKTVGYSKTQFIKDIQAAIGAGVDGVAGNQTLSKTVTVSKNINNRHAVVKPIQRYLNLLGYECGTADGVAGGSFHNAVVLYQRSKGLYADGEITACKSTWKALLGL